MTGTGTALATPREPRAVSRTLVLAACLLVIGGPGRARAEPELVEVPHPEMSHLEPTVADRLNGLRGEFDERVTQRSGPALADLYGKLGMLYHVHSQLEPAAACYLNATRLTPEDFRWRYYLGLVHEALSDLEAANVAFRHVLELNQHYDPARMHLAANLITAGDFDAAEREYEGLADKLEDSAVVLTGLGRIAEHRKDYRKAVDYYERALQAEPSASQLHYYLAMGYRRLGDRDKAAHHAELRGIKEPVMGDPLLASLASLSFSTQEYLERGYAAFRNGNYRVAMAQCQRAIEVYPEDPTARLSLGRALALLGDTRQALRMFDQALELDPDHAVANYRKATVLEYIALDEQAIEYYRRALAADPEFADARLLLANMLMRSGQYREAAENYARVNLPDRESLVRYREGIAHMGAGNCQGAATALERAHELESSRGEIMKALARLYSTCPEVAPQNRERALEFATLLYETLPNGEQAETLAMASAANGRFDDAVDYQTQTIFEALRDGTLANHPTAEETLKRYRAGSVATQAWPPDDDVFDPPRVRLDSA